MLEFIIYLPIYLFIYLSICLSIYLSIYLSIHLYTLKQVSSRLKYNILFKLKSKFFKFNSFYNKMT